MPDEIEQTTDIHHPDTEIEATNKSLNDFVAEHVKGYVADPTAQPSNDENKLGEVAKDPTDEAAEKTKNELAAADETPPEPLDDKAKDEAEAAKAEADRLEAEKAATEAEPDAKVVEGQPVPYTRFQEVAREKTELKQRVEQLQPIAENYSRITDFCRQNNIVPDQFEKAMRVQALLNTNPAEALKELLPIVESLQGFVGNRLPEDLQSKVDAGKMEIDDAREMAKLRAQTSYREAMTKQNAETSQRYAQERAVADVTKAAKDWETSKRSSDPDYKPVAEGQSDGLWEDVRDKFAALLNQRDAQGNFANPVHSAQEMVVLQERAYKAVKDKWTSRLAPKRPATAKRLSSNGGSTHHETTVIEEAKTMREAVAIRMKQRGVVSV